MNKLGFHIAYCHFTKISNENVRISNKNSHFWRKIVKWHPFLLQQRLRYHLSKIWYSPGHQDYHLSFLHFQFCLVHFDWVLINVPRKEKCILRPILVKERNSVIWPILAVHGVILSSDLGLSLEMSSPAASSMPCRTNSTSLLIFAVIIVHINFNATPTNAHKNKIYGYWLKCFRLDEAYLGSKTTSGPDFRSRLNSRLWNPRIGDWAYLWAKS